MPSLDVSESLGLDYYVQVLDSAVAQQWTSSTISIPLKGDEEVVIDANDELPEDPTELCDLLENEEAGKDQWLSIARAYANQGRFDESAEVIKRGLSSSTIIDSTSDVQASFHTFLAWLYLSQQFKSQDSFSLDLANNESNTAFSLNPESLNTGLAMGILSLESEGKLDRASSIFDDILKRQPSNCYAFMGKAKVLFQKGNYSASLKLFQTVLSNNPLITPDPRIGIGLCFWKLDNKLLARKAWENSLKVNPDSKSIAKLLLCFSAFDECFTGSQSDEHFLAGYAEALTQLKEIYTGGSHDESILIVLASYYYSCGKYDLVDQICNKVLASSKSPSVVGDAQFWLGRCRFAERQYVEAQKHFLDSIKAKDDNLLAKIGYGQCQIARGEFGEAIISFEKVLKENPKTLEVIYILGILYSKDKSSTTKSISYLEKYLQLCKESGFTVYLPAYLSLSQAYEDENTTKSLKYLQQAKELLESEQKNVPYSLLNNIGVFSLLRVEKGNPSVDIFDEALEAHKEQAGSDAVSVILKYNKARALESSQETVSDAIRLYEEILDVCPNYASAKIRWLLLSSLSGDNVVKNEVLNLLEANPDDLEVRSFYGWYARRYGRQQDIKQEAESEHHRDTLVKYDSHDLYALISLGNVYCAIARDIRNGSAKDEERKNGYYIRAAQLYQKVLSIDPKNAYAAQGIAIIFADRKQSGAALEIFRKVRDSLQDMSVYINLGNCLVEVKQYAKAIESYDIALSKFTSGEDSRLFVLLGRAWYGRGAFEKNLDAIRQSLDFSKKAYALNPIPALSFNVAFVQFQVADFIRRLPEQKRTVESLEDALQELEEAISSLEKLADEPHPPYPAEDIKARASMGTNTLKNQLIRCIEEQKQYEIKTAERLEEAKKLRAEQEEKLAEAKERELAAARENEKRLAEERRKLQVEAEDWIKNQIDLAKDENDELEPTEDGAEKEPKKKKAASGTRKTRKKKAKIVDSDEEEAAGESKGPVPKKRRVNSKKPELSNEFVVDSEEDMPDVNSDANDDPSEKEANPSDDGDDGEEEGLF
ncbi:unnamed protein product [Kuraishia capsulata CBS 1993]|uniref:Uncharacterized protein n=1 Tax=Kuraishia capsulata CBS 1993 TaxID=1382522 RepID=W6MJQ1_9ASCO|nr:uncharacterized protein KUCA_T00002748001 [Kuraishia capsulata CBS 1993]CDK26774.1 unnamed protein product [Kuraishia capsulata CBS 1993]